MFRLEEVFWGGWQDKTIEAMRKRRYKQNLERLEPLGAERLDALTSSALERRLETCWQSIERKPLRKQQLAQIWQGILNNIEIHADCLSKEEHELVERAIILGGTAPIEDAAELEAARALSLRLWASVGLVSGKPYIEMEWRVLQPIAQAFVRAEHEQVRIRLNRFRDYLSGTLYRVGVLDDRQPQQMLLREVFGADKSNETLRSLTRRYLWASFDCVDYRDGVMLIHPALAEPQVLIQTGQRRKGILVSPMSSLPIATDILPEEVPLQQELEQSIEGAMRDGHAAKDVAQTIRLLCKQGAPLDALEEILQESLIVFVSPTMRRALADMYYMTPKWVIDKEKAILQ